MIYVNRLTHQKMADVMLQALPMIAASRIQLVVHGKGDRSFESGFCEMARQHPKQLTVRIGYRNRWRIA
jgi:starch synthase